MPTVLKLFGFTFSFYSNEGIEPPHIHIKKGGSETKYWLDSLTKEYNYGFKNNELKKIEAILEEHQAFLIEEWYKFFSDE